MCERFLKPVQGWNSSLRVAANRNALERRAEIASVSSVACCSLANLASGNLFRAHIICKPFPKLSFRYLSLITLFTYIIITWKKVLKQTDTHRTKIRDFRRFCGFSRIKCPQKSLGPVISFRRVLVWTENLSKHLFEKKLAGKLLFRISKRERKTSKEEIPCILFSKKAFSVLFSVLRFLSNILFVSFIEIN